LESVDEIGTRTEHDVMMPACFSLSTSCPLISHSLPEKPPEQAASEAGSPMFSGIADY
jgi:hypothetical protein